MNKKSKRIPFSLIMFIILCTYSLAQTPQMIDVGGYKLEVYLRGSGNPTVVLEAGLGSDHRTWSTIIPYVTQFTSVVSYSRAGLGKSEQRNNQLSFEQIILDLNIVLDSLKIN